MDPYSLATLSDRDLLVKFYELQSNWDTIPAGEAENLAEQCNTVGHVIDSRFGPDSVDLLASYFTASHASANDAIWWARERTEILVEIARDVHQCHLEPSGRCRCGAITAEFSQTK